MLTLNIFTVSFYNDKYIVIGSRTVHSNSLKLTLKKKMYLNDKKIA